MTPRLPDETGFVERDGVRVHWERFGDGDQTLSLLPAWALFPSAHWKMQVPYLARSFRVIVIEGRGRGLSASTTRPVNGCKCPTRASCCRPTAS